MKYFFAHDARIANGCEPTRLGATQDEIVHFRGGRDGAAAANVERCAATRQSVVAELNRPLVKFRLSFSPHSNCLL